MLLLTPGYFHYFIRHGLKVLKNRDETSRVRMGKLERRKREKTRTVQKEKKVRILA